VETTDSVARAMRLAPQLAARAFETDRARRMLPENVALLRDAGLVRVRQPARLVLQAVASEIELWAGRREVMPPGRRAEARMDCAYAVRPCLEATEILYLASGSAGLAETSALQLAVRDLHAINMHGLLALKTNLETYGRVLLGLPPNTPVL